MSEVLEKIKKAIKIKFKKEQELIDYMRSRVPNFVKEEMVDIISGGKTNIKKYSKAIYEFSGVMLVDAPPKKKTSNKTGLGRKDKVVKEVHEVKKEAEPHKIAEIRNEVCKIVIPLKKADGISFSMDEIKKDWGVTITSGRNYFEFILTEPQKELIRTGKKIEVCITIRGNSNEK